MYQIEKTEAFDQWFHDLRDVQAKARILSRLRNVSLGNLGDVAPVGAGVSEMRIHYGPGYRIYFMQRGTRLIVLLAGGNKATQTRDIRLAKILAADL